MVVQTIRQRICDECGSSDKVEQYRIVYVRIARTLTVDLCPEHGAPLEAWAKKLPTGKRGKTVGQPVVSEAEVRKARRTTTARKKPAVKRA